ncbi:hypothetical protein Sjap_018858 [Stephania japonica]|uniref:Phosphoglycerate mutase-like protein 1 n=1 Tax=Stephania japonica TaxID=461633 RepID=A0AAP0NL06_9MAGN
MSGTCFPNLSPISPKPSSLRSSSFSPKSPTRSSLPDMDGSACPSLFPLHRCKTLHLVRHAQGFHNVAGEKDHSAYLSPELFDAQLTPLGWQQVDNLRKHVNACGLSKKIELVIASPLLRTMQTAVGVFGGGDYTDGLSVTPLMVANAGNSNRSAISSLNSPPFAAVELCREHLGVHFCDKRRSVSEYELLFPAIDFSLMETNEDILWKVDVREANEEVAERGKKFMDWLVPYPDQLQIFENLDQHNYFTFNNWLWTRKEKEIAIVTHSGFLFHTLNALGKDLHPLMKEEVCKHFANCELRSIIIVDKSVIGSGNSETNYPGKIPSGLDLPSDSAPAS